VKEYVYELIITNMQLSYDLYVEAIFQYNLY